jgi:hypothetical protein
MIKNIKDFFVKIDKPTAKAIKPENDYNMDKTKITKELGYNGFVFGSLVKIEIVKNPNSRSWIPILKHISETNRSQAFFCYQQSIGL